MPTIEVLDPRGALRVTEQPLAPRNGKLARTRIGFLSNKKANATLLLQEIERILLASFVDFEAVYV